MLHQAYESTLMLIKDILGRILRPSAIREHLRGDISKIDVTQLLDASDFDVGAQCRVELERLYDDDCDTEYHVRFISQDISNRYIIMSELKYEQCFSKCSLVI